MLPWMVHELDHRRPSFQQALQEVLEPRRIFTRTSPDEGNEPHLPVQTWATHGLGGKIWKTMAMHSPQLGFDSFKKLTGHRLWGSTQLLWTFNITSFSSPLSKMISATCAKLKPLVSVGYPVYRNTPKRSKRSHLWRNM